MPIPGLQQVHHIAIIVANYALSKHFYCDILGFTLREEHYRAERNSWKGELFLNGHYVIELFSFPQPPARLSYPEACGLRHLAFLVDDIHQAVQFLNDHHICCESLRIDLNSGKYFTFFADPDGLPLELCQA